MPDNEWVIQTSHLTRYFGRKAAVDDLNLRVPRGCVFGFLGRNGSGKTTTIRMLLGLIEPTRGSATVLGCDSRCLSPSVRSQIGYMPENHPSYGWMTVEQNGLFQGSFYPGQWNQKVFDGVIEYFRLDRKAKAKDLSRGERAGLSLAMTLAPEPQLLILDDPALGLDPVARRSLVEAMIYVTRRSDRTILFSSHILSDVERVADHVAVLDRAVLRAACPVDVFRTRVRQFVLHYTGRPPALPQLKGLLHTRYGNGEMRLTVANINGDAKELASIAGVTSVEEAPISLEEALIGYLDDRGATGFFLSEVEHQNTTGGRP